MIALQDLKTIIRAGLLSSPVTPLDAADRFNHKAFRAHLEWLADYPVAGLIVAGGTGELFSLTPGRVVEVVRTAKEVSGDAPIISGCGYGTKMACEMAQGIEAAGGDDILLLPGHQGRRWLARRPTRPRAAPPDRCDRRRNRNDGRTCRQPAWPSAAPARVIAGELR